MPTLRCLSLAYTRLTDRAIDVLLQLPRLEQLDLAGTRISAAAIDRLATLPALIELGLSDCDDDAIERAYARPQWHVAARDQLAFEDDAADARRIGSLPATA